MHRRRNKNKLLITGLLVIVFLMATGYAAFYQKLNISGVSNISSVWDVQITGITKSAVNGNVTEVSKPTYTKDSATFNVDLESPGNYIYYKVAVTNKGSLYAIAKMGKLNCDASNILKCGAYPENASQDIGSNTNLENNRLIIGPGETEYYNVWVKYDTIVTGEPDVKNINITLSLTYEQSDVGSTQKTDDNCYTAKVLSNGTLSITKYNEECGTSVVIPDKIDDYTVTEIANGKWDSTLGKTVSPFSNMNITSVVIPDTVTKIGGMSFRNNKIKNLTLGQNVVEIGSEAFAVNKIESLSFPASLKSLGSQAFLDNSLTNIDIPRLLFTAKINKGIQK